MRLGEQSGQLRRQPPHFLLEWLAVVLLLLDTHIPPGGENVVLPGDLLGIRHGAEALDVLQRPGCEGVVGVRNFLDILLAQLPQLAGDHGAHLPGVDEQGFALLLFVPVEEPQGDGDLGGVEQLSWHSDDAVHQIGLDDVLPNFPLAPRLGGQGAVSQHHADPPAGGQVVDHVLEPGEVGVARRGLPVLPPGVVSQLVRPPVGEVEGGIGHDKVGPQGWVAVVEECIRVETAQVGVNPPDR